ncbi:Lrp/AsnC family transcriptional regulator [Roseovarius rhodophyticola]|uniref:Lrp/AsnC family transcriptional regulator n=1 Tax=Roseovarius rhodophyticola TaxID=3080827 RepID=A0ABZ2TP21_9RHOB|nr:Lrp/AsnC family transcriptional regulator [Roseovarius sp. W115]MDV2927857.1 Lrp/AsnC family transcriptional regulator [Roseovarius sp. W115]
MDSDKLDKHRFDDLDRRLVALLMRDGRAPVAKLADILSVSRSTVQNRLDRMLQSGALLGFTARVREDYEDGQINAIMMIKISGKSTTQVITNLRRLPELRRVHTTSGKWGLVAEIRVATLAEFDRTLREVRQIDNIYDSETSMLLTSV